LIDFWSRVARLIPASLIDGYRTEIGIRISTEEATGLPSSIAGKNRQRRNASIRFRLSSGLSVGCTRSTTELPSAATSNRATATTSIFWRRRSSGRSGSGLKRARAESLPPPRPVAGGCDADSPGTAAVSALSEALLCALSSGAFAGCAGGAGRMRSRRRFGSGGFGTVTGSCGASWRAPVLELGISTIRASSGADRMPGRGGPAITCKNTSKSATDTRIAPGSVQGSRCQGLSTVRALGT